MDDHPRLDRYERNCNMSMNLGMTRSRGATVLGLVIGAAGIGVLWAAGIEFPVAIPPGLVILLVGAVVVGLVHRPSAAAFGAFLGLFVLVGFLASPTGIDNISGEEGAVVAAGQAVQLIGVITALTSGVVAFRAERRLPSGPRQQTDRVR